MMSNLARNKRSVFATLALSLASALIIFAAAHLKVISGWILALIILEWFYFFATSLINRNWEPAYMGLILSGGITTIAYLVS